MMDLIALHHQLAPRGHLFSISLIIYGQPADGSGSFSGTMNEWLRRGSRRSMSASSGANSGACIAPGHNWQQKSMESRRQDRQNHVSSSSYPEG